MLDAPQDPRPGPSGAGFFSFDAHKEMLEAGECRLAWAPGPVNDTQWRPLSGHPRSCSRVRKRSTEDYRRRHEVQPPGSRERGARVRREVAARCDKAVSRHARHASCTMRTMLVSGRRTTTWAPERDHPRVAGDASAVIHRSTSWAWNVLSPDEVEGESSARCLDCPFPGTGQVMHVHRIVVSEHPYPRTASTQRCVTAAARREAHASLCKEYCGYLIEGDDSG